MSQTHDFRMLGGDEIQCTKCRRIFAYSEKGDVEDEVCDAPPPQKPPKLTKTRPRSKSNKR